MEMNHNWLKDPTVFSVNRLDPVSSHRFYASEEEMKEKKSSYIHSLNGYWKFHYANSLDEVIPNFYTLEYSCENWDEIAVPAHIQMQGYGTPMYVNQIYPWSAREDIRPGQIPNENPIGSYITYFDRSLLKDNTDTRIVFHGAESGLALWVNGKFVGYSEDSFTPSAFDITDYLVEGKNKIAVNVYRFTSGSWLEDQDFWRFSGIFRDVELQSIPRVHINDLKITQNMQEIGKSVDVNVDTDILTKDTANEVSCTLCDAENRVIDEGKMVDDHISFTIKDPSLWYAERPYLYHVVIRVKDMDGYVEFIRQNIGIRKFELHDGLMYLNGKRIVFHGVNRHEFCAESGRVVSYALTKNDIKVMKENNINAIRTSHYPNQNFFYDLCDEMGMYVIDEVNLETHGTWSEMFDRSLVIPDDKPEWKDVLIDRAKSMYERDKNHPCILIWSCGNESFGGKNIYEMSQFFRKQDSSRLVHYEGVSLDQRYPDTTDMISRMYTPAAEIERILQQNPKKPFILCEYAHSMGNSNGALYKYTNLEDTYPKYQGGFIWDFVDQALLVNGSLHYGGDFRERPSDYDFCGNGLLFADRTVTPKMQEVKYCYQNIKISINKKVIQFANKYLYWNLSDFVIRVSLMQNGYVVEQKQVSLECEAGKLTSMPMPFIIPADGNEYAIYVQVEKDDLEVAHEQYVCPASKKCGISKLPVTITEDYLNIGVRGNGFSLIYSKQKGIVSYKVHGKEWIRVPLRPNFFRASTNNDVENAYGYRYGQWLINSLYAKQCFDKYEKQVSYCRIYTHYELPSTEIALKVVYTINGDGTIAVEMDMPENMSHIEMPCFGMLLETYPEANKVTYYGNGPKENYIDRNTGAILGRYSYQVKENMTPYLYPQECGNRTGVRECAIYDNKHVLTISGKSFECSVLPYTPYVIENAKHQTELPNSYETAIVINEEQMGVAGDNTWGARTHPEFLLSRKKHHFKFFMRAK